PGDARAGAGGGGGGGGGGAGPPPPGRWRCRGGGAPPAVAGSWSRRPIASAVSVARSKGARNRSTRPKRLQLPRPSAAAARRRFSSTVSLGKRLVRWKEREMPRRATA